MKLRVQHNSIRFRLGQSEVVNLWDSGECREVIEFPGGSRLEYVLSASDSESFGVSFREGMISVAVPALQLSGWHSSNQVGMNAEIPVRDGEALKVLIEKDFRCLDAGTEDQPDAFENPLGAHASC